MLMYAYTALLSGFSALSANQILRSDLSPLRSDLSPLRPDLSLFRPDLSSIKSLQLYIRTILYLINRKSYTNGIAFGIETDFTKGRFHIVAA